ncbi:unnamed protein product [Leptidea sinapis]|uniref:Tudor domain-containing protein n=1 Tax=Leptidea sinapis TaxID=189913 RepID=A0A5E4QPL8_9NEOP|nr:unnamed protein product [Leptidea sinapis]
MILPTKQNFAIYSRQWVQLTHVENPHNFYVHLSSFATFVDTINNLNVDQLENPTQIDLGDIVIYKARKTRKAKYLRGKILKINFDESPTYNIFSIDYGFNDENVSRDHIYTCAPHYKNTPQLAMHCQLHGCNPNGTAWNEDATDAMMSLAGIRFYEEICS